MKNITPHVVLEHFRNISFDGTDRWRATCPAHGSGNSKNLSIRIKNGWLQLKCWAGCSEQDILEVLGLTRRSLRVGEPQEHSSRPIYRTTSPRSQHGRDRKAFLERVWSQALPLKRGDTATRYLEARGLRLEALPVALRLHPALAYHHEGQRVGSFPAMLARVEHPEHGLVTLHRTYLAPDGSGKAEVPSPKKLMTPVFEGAGNGAAIRLFAPTEGQRLALAEGIETALAVHQATGWPVWSCVSAGGLERVILPPEARAVVICADHDRVNPSTGERTGWAAAQSLAHRLIREGRRVWVAQPPLEGQDWLDVLNTEGGAQ